MSRGRRRCRTSRSALQGPRGLSPAPYFTRATHSSPVTGEVHLQLPDSLLAGAAYRRELGGAYCLAAGSLYPDGLGSKNSDKLVVEDSRGSTQPNV